MAIQVASPQEMPDVRGSRTPWAAASAWWCFWMRGAVPQVQLDVLEDLMADEVKKALEKNGRNLPDPEIFIAREGSWAGGYLHRCAEGLSLSDALTLCPFETMGVRNKLVWTGGYYLTDTSMIVWARS